jgi:GntR family phosphonate transport system transcriptional regulator
VTITGMTTRGATIRRGDGVALWRQIADALRDDITQGAYPPGQRLPTEIELATRFGVNRHTVRQAVSTLADEGLLSVEQGRGTFVPERLLDYPVGKRTRFSANARKSGSPQHELLDVTLAPASREAAVALGLRTGDSLVVVHILDKISGRPVNVGVHHFSARRFPGLAAVFRETASVTEALRRSGVEDYTRLETRITARPATAEETDLLRLPRGRSLLITEAINVDVEGRRLEYGISRFAADRVQLVFES